MAAAAHAELAVATIGYRVTREPRTGRVHSVFAQACNIAVDTTLVTIVVARDDDGPTTLRLAPCGPLDLSRCFTPGEDVALDREGLRTLRVALRWADARVWHPAVPPSLALPAAIAARCTRARAYREQHATQRASVLERSARPLVAAWHDACTLADREAARRCIARLIGLGEGLTPAGDDFLVGALAALDAIAANDPAQRELHDAVARAIVAQLARTTPISAHLLRLASDGHHGAALLRLRDALLGEHRESALHDALAAACAIGATSGVDTVNGLLTTIGAVLEARCRLHNQAATA